MRSEEAFKQGQSPKIKASEKGKESFSRPHLARSSLLLLFLRSINPEKATSVSLPRIDDATLARSEKPERGKEIDDRRRITFLIFPPNSSHIPPLTC